MSKKRSRENKPPSAEAPAAPTAPDKLTHRGLSPKLKALRDAMAAEEAAKVRAAEEKRKAAEARGERVGPPPKAPQAQAPSRTPPSRPSATEVWRPDLDKELFAVAMSGVVPLMDKDRPPRVKPGGGGGQPGVGRGGSSGSSLRRAQAEGDDGIVVRWREDGGCEGSRRGRSFALEALGRFASPQDSLDLHGLEPAEARTRVEEFVRTRRARGMRTVRVVHGLGRHAPDGTSLLRDAAVKALSEPPGSREVDAFQTADPAQGGAGALMVALRRS